MADAIRWHNKSEQAHWKKFNQFHIDTIANFCAFQSSQFKRDRWLDYIAGECGPNGGSINK